jgi:hypothetical protein
MPFCIVRPGPDVAVRYASSGAPFGALRACDPEWLGWRRRRRSTRAALPASPSFGPAPARVRRTAVRGARRLPRQGSACSRPLGSGHSRSARTVGRTRRPRRLGQPRGAARPSQGPVQRSTLIVRNQSISSASADARSWLARAVARSRSPSASACQAASSGNASRLPRRAVVIAFAISNRRPTADIPT